MSSAIGLRYILEALRLVQSRLSPMTTIQRTKTLLKICQQSITGQNQPLKSAIQYVSHHKYATSFFNFQDFYEKNAEKLSLPAVGTPAFSPVVLLRLLDDPVLPQHRYIRLDRHGKPFVQKLDSLQQPLIGR